MEIPENIARARTIVVSMLVGGTSWFATFLATPQLAVPLLILGTFVGATGSVIYNVSQVSFRQTIVPLELQGRLNATMRFLVWGTIPMGAIMGRVLGGIVGLRTAIGMSAVGATLAFLWVLLSPRAWSGVSSKSPNRMIPALNPATLEVSGIHKHSAPL